MKGTVQSVSAKGNSIKVNGEWYSAFAASSINGAGVGDEVEFEFIQKGQYKNIKGSVKKVSASGGSTGGNPAPAGGGRNFNPMQARQFPVPPTAPERAINRQNALTNAVAAVDNFGSNDDIETITDYAQQIIEVARMFEAYTTGDIDLAEAKAALGVDVVGD